MKLDPEVIRLHNMGFAIHWLRRKSKIPVEKGWTEGPRWSLKELAERFRPGQNPGVRLGSVSEVGGGYLAVVDLDVKSEDPAHLEQALEWLGTHYPEAAIGPCLKSGRGNGSAHYYVRVKRPISKNDVKARSSDIVKVRMPSVSPNAEERHKLTLAEIALGIRFRPAWEISLLCEGRQAAIVGAIHPDTDARYEWGNRPESADDLPFIDVVGHVETLAPTTATGGVDFVDVDLDTLGLREEQIKAIVEGVGVRDRSAEIFSLCMAMVQRKVPDNVILSIFTDSQYYLGTAALERQGNDRQRAANWVAKYCLAKAKTQVAKSNLVFDYESEAPAETPKWQDQLETTGNPPKIKSTYANLRLILANACGTAAFLTHDRFSNNHFFTTDTPWGNTKGQPRSGNTTDALKIKTWLVREYAIEPSTGQIDEVLLATADENPCHPLQEYLDGLQWDGVERIATAFKTYLGADMPEPYLSEVTRKFFLACVRRAYEPGCKFDHVPILEGFQGKGKSTFVRYLVGDAWFMDHLPPMSDKDAALYLQGVWVCELGELATLNKSGNDVVKGFIARTTDKFRPPYGQRRVDFPRTTLFIGTTDQDEYLNDPAGNRRFWPVRVTQCDFKAVLRDRDQLWAEAVFYHQFTDEPLWLNGKAAEQIQAIHGVRKIEDENEFLTGAWDHWAKDGELPDQVTISELFNPGMPFIVAHRTPLNTRAAARVLRKRGYKQKHTEKGNVWVHTKKDLKQ